MRILLLTTLVPAGPPSGGTLATLDLTQRLEAYGEVERWAVWTYENDATENHVWRGPQLVSLPGLRRHGALRAVGRLVPLSVSRFYRADVARALARAGLFDVFVADHVGVWQYAPTVSANRHVLHTHNVESELYERATLLERSLPKRVVWRYEARTMARYESEAYRAADGVLCLGTRDKVTIAERFGVSAHAWYPALVTAQPVLPKQARGKVIGVVGSMTWQPNRWGMDWFVENAWPLVRRRIPDAQLRIAGRGSDQLPYATEPGIEALGALTDLETFYESVDVVVAPILGGAGIKMKTLDAAARGLPVVTTSTGVEGLGEHLPAAVTVANSGAEFAELVAATLVQCRSLPIAESVAWYQTLVAGGTTAVQQALLG